MQYVLNYIAQVISVCLPSEHDLPQATAPVSLKRHGPAWIEFKSNKEADLLARWKTHYRIPRSNFLFMCRLHSTKRLIQQIHGCDPPETKLGLVQFVPNDLHMIKVRQAFPNMLLKLD